MQRSSSVVSGVGQRIAHLCALALLIVQLGAAWHVYDLAAHQDQAPQECSQCLGAHGAAQGHVAGESMPIIYGADIAPSHFSSTSAASKSRFVYHSRAPPV